MARPSAAAKPSRTTIRSLTPDPRNANKGSERGTGMLEHSLRQYGAGRSLLVDKHGVVIAGNKTLEAAASLGMDEIQIVQSDGTKLVVVQRTDLDLSTDAKAKELAVADNRVAQVSLDWDADVLRQLADEGADLSALFTKDELADLVDLEPIAGLTDPDDVPEPRATDIRLGDMFQLGRHRLLCGDCTDPALVERLMDGTKAGLMNTDPPYGVTYANDDRPNPGVAKPRVANDTLTGDDLGRFLESIFGVAKLVALAENAGWYVWFGNMNQVATFQAAAAAAGVILHRQIIWVKPVLLLGRGQYHWKHEPCFMGWVDGNQPPDYGLGGGERTQTTVWEVAHVTQAERKEFNHSTPKPVGLFTIPIVKHLRAGQACYEPFAGSGPQFIAAEQHGVSCYGSELEPRFCQVIIDRWEAFTGQKAEKVGEVALAS